MNEGASGRPRLAWTLTAVVGTMAVGALIAGGAMIADPSGATIGLSMSLLAPTVFADYLVPGLVLFTLLGVGGVVVFAGLVARFWWAWPAAYAYGLLLLVWISVQVSIMGLISPIQPVVGVAGLAVIWHLVQSPITDYYAAHESLQRIVRPS